MTRPSGLTPRMTQGQAERFQRAAHAHKVGDLERAEAEYRVLLGQGAVAPELYTNLGQVCATTGRVEEAANWWRKALAVAPEFTNPALFLGQYYSETGDLDGAERTFRRLLAHHPGLVQARYLLANVLKSRGAFAEAAQLYQQILAQQPDYTQAHFLYATIHPYASEDDPHLRTLQELDGRPGLPREARIHLAFALAKAYEDIGERSRSFEHLTRGNALRAEAYGYTIDSDAALFRNIMHTFRPEAMAGLELQAEPSDKPIFIVGMPRSGTSLVEKILASHPDVHGAGELDTLYTLAGRLFLSQSGNGHFLSLGQYPASHFQSLGRDYLTYIETLDPAARRVTDKLPFNFMMVGLIRLALPNATIVHCVRDARDNCLSIYKQNFTTDNYRFAYDLRSLGLFHNLYRDLMRHWHRVFPGAIYDLDYAALARNPEPETRKLLEACQLAWHPDCLDFSKTPGTVKTASAYQVRQPMYTRTIGLWRQYEADLQPLFEALAAGGD